VSRRESGSLYANGINQGYDVVEMLLELNYYDLEDYDAAQAKSRVMLFCWRARLPEFNSRVECKCDGG
jgi:hypothetical protein